MRDIKIVSNKHIIREKLISCFVAVAFLFNSICLLANILFPSLENFGEIFIIVFLILGMAVCLTASFRINFGLLSLNSIILLAILASYLYYDSPEIIKTLMNNYIVWGIGVTVIMMQKYDIRRTLDILYWLSLVIILFELVAEAEQKYESFTWTYSVLPCVATVIIHFTYCRFSNLILKITYIPGFFMLIKFILNANRGGLISILLLLFFISIKSLNSVNSHLKSRKILTILLATVAIAVGVFFEQITLLLYNYMQNLDFNIQALSKMYRLMEVGNITNNRQELYSYAWHGFVNSPIWGNGIGGFSVNHGGWTHNLILQLLYEGGILLSSLVLIPLAKNCLFVLREKRLTGDEYSLFVLFFSASIPKLMFSTELWSTQSFWMLFAFCMLIRCKYSNHKKNKLK